MLNNVDWQKILCKTAANISAKMKLDIIVEDFILQEISDRIDFSLKQINIEKPNVAKIAGLVMFWVRKLKPFSYDRDECAKAAKFCALNELIGIQAGIAICRKYSDDFSAEDFHISKRLLKDWLHSLRYHSHSPYSSVIAFELLTTATKE